jgi:hypothetical protein
VGVRIARTTGKLFLLGCWGVFFSSLTDFLSFFCKFQLVGVGIVWITEAWVGFVVLFLPWCWGVFFLFSFLFFVIFAFTWLLGGCFLLFNLILSLFLL